MWYEEQQLASRPAPERSGPIARALALVVALEAAYMLTHSLAFFVQLKPNYPLWPMGVFFSILWPLTFGWAAYGLWRPRLAQSRAEALLRSIPVWVVMLLNVVLIAVLPDRPEMVLRSPF